VRATCLSCVAAAATIGLLGSWLGCAGPYSGDPEVLPVPKVAKKKAGAVQTGSEPDTCKPNFDANAQASPRRALRDQAKGFAQDADNTLSGADTADWPKKRNMVLAALATLGDALRMDPYSPSATYEMAVAYAWVGKKKCAVAMLTRLNEIGTGFPDLVPEISKLKQKAKNEAAFEGMRKEADAALP
jgi:hypothetical protein